MNPNCREIADGEWRPVAGFEGFYEVSNHGGVRSVDRTIWVNGRNLHRKLKGKLLTQKSRDGEHFYVDLSRGNEVERKWVHRLVLEAFVSPMGEAELARHRDGNARNNHVENLAWGSFAENNLDTVAHGNHYQATKTECKRGHPLEAPNLVEGILKHGRRSCKACNRALAYISRNSHLDLKEVSDKYFIEIMEN